MPKSPKATNGEPYPWNSLRLPDFVKPLRYNLTIHPNLTTYDVKGKVVIICKNVTLLSAVHQVADQMIKNPNNFFSITMD
jgi:hypothetical protein